MSIASLIKPKGDIAFIRENNSIRQGLEKMKAHSFTAVPVIDDNGVYVGTVSEGDFLWKLYGMDTSDKKAVEHTYVRDIMKPDLYKPVKITASGDEVLMRAMEQNYIPVVDDRNVFIGIITRKDIIKTFYEEKLKETYNMNE